MTTLQRIGEALSDDEVLMSINMIDVGPGDSYVVDIRCTHDNTEALHRDNWERHIIDTGAPAETYNNIWYHFPSRLNALKKVIDEFTPVPFTPDAVESPRIASFTATHFDADHAANGAAILKHIDKKDAKSYRPFTDRTIAALGPTNVYSYPVVKALPSSFDIDVSSVGSASPLQHSVTVKCTPSPESRGVLQTIQGSLALDDIKFLPFKGKTLPEFDPTPLYDPADLESYINGLETVVQWDGKADDWNDVEQIGLKLTITATNRFEDAIRVPINLNFKRSHPQAGTILSTGSSPIPLGITDAESIDKAVKDANRAAATAPMPGSPPFDHFYLQQLQTLPAKPLSSDDRFEHHFSAETTDDNPFRESKIMSAPRETVLDYYQQMLEYQRTSGATNFIPLLINSVSLVQRFQATRNDGTIIFTAYFTGDAYYGQGPIHSRLDDLFPPGQLPLNTLVLKVPHHGSNSTSLDFWKRVRASVYLISASYPAHPGGHPTIANLKAIIDTRGVLLAHPRIIFVSPDTRRGKPPDFNPVDPESNIMKVLTSNQSTAYSANPGDKPLRNYRCFALKTRQDNWKAKIPPNSVAAIGRIRIGLHAGQTTPTVEWNLPSDTFATGNEWEDITTYAR